MPYRTRNNPIYVDLWVERHTNKEPPFMNQHRKLFNEWRLTNKRLYYSYGSVESPES